MSKFYCILVNETVDETVSLTVIGELFVFMETKILVNVGIAKKDCRRTQHISTNHASSTIG